jgi:hypothetical protein
MDLSSRRLQPVVVSRGSGMERKDRQRPTPCVGPRSKLRAALTRAQRGQLDAANLAFCGLAAPSVAFVAVAVNGQCIKGSGQ